MRAEPPPDHAILDAWREQGADRLDPYAFHCMQALRRRAAERDGATRRALEEKLTERIQAYAEALARGAHVIATPVRDACRARGPLGELAAELGARSAQRGKASDGAAASSALPELGMLEDFRKLWTEVRSDSQLRRSLQPSPQGTGPLNSSSLVHRSLKLMRELSPGYLQQFLSYLDALSWLEQMKDGGVLAAQEPAARELGKVRTRAKPRKRRE